MDVWHFRWYYTHTQEITDNRRFNEHDVIARSSEIKREGKEYVHIGREERNAR